MKVVIGGILCAVGALLLVGLVASLTGLCTEPSCVQLSQEFSKSPASGWITAGFCLILVGGGVGLIRWGRSSSS